MISIQDYWRNQTRERRDKARQSGVCVICMTKPARPDRKTCGPCSAKATELTARRRKALRAAHDLNIPPSVVAAIHHHENPDPRIDTDGGVAFTSPGR